MAAQVARVVAEGYRSLCRALLTGRVASWRAGKRPHARPALRSAPRAAPRKDGPDPYLVWRLAGRTQEIMVCLFYGQDGGFLGEHVARGGPAAVSTDRARLTRHAVELGARYVILAHNHPQGEARPSRQDLHATRQTYRLFDALGMRLVDHAIVTRGGACFSFREEGLI